MRTGSTNLLQQLGSGVIPVDLPGLTPRNDSLSFDAMLREAGAGRIASGLPVTNAHDTSFEAQDLELFAHLADAAQAAGVGHLAVALGRRFAIINIELRRAQEVPGILADQIVTPHDIRTGIDGLVVVLRDEESGSTPAESGRQSQRTAHGRAVAIPMSHPAVAELLAGVETPRN